MACMIILTIIVIILIIIHLLYSIPGDAIAIYGQESKKAQFTLLSGWASLSHVTEQAVSVWWRPPLSSASLAFPAPLQCRCDVRQCKPCNVGSGRHLNWRCWTLNCCIRSISGCFQGCFCLWSSICLTRRALNCRYNCCSSLLCILSLWSLAKRTVLVS